MSDKGLVQREFELDEIKVYEVTTMDEVETMYSTEDRIKEYAFRKCYIQRPTGGLTVNEQGSAAVVFHINPSNMMDGDSKPVLSSVQQFAVAHILTHGPSTAAGVLGPYRMFVCEKMNTKKMLGEMLELTLARTGNPLQSLTLPCGNELFHLESQVV